MSVQIPEYSNPYLRTASSGSSGPGDAAPAKASEDGEKETEGTNGASGNGDVIDAVFGDASDKAVSMEDFLTLMVAQLKNQDFMNPVDDTQYVTQLAQISTMQDGYGCKIHGGRGLKEDGRSRKQGFPAGRKIRDLCGRRILRHG